MNMNILGTVSEVNEGSRGLMVYSVYELDGAVFRTPKTSISHSYMYDLSIYDSDKIDEIVFDNTYDSFGRPKNLSLGAMRKIVGKVPKLKPIIRNLVIGGVIGGK